jgi:hypothetical protein
MKRTLTLVTSVFAGQRVRDRRDNVSGTTGQDTPLCIEGVPVPVPVFQSKRARAWPPRGHPSDSHERAAVNALVRSL